jgi:hypothetical protein
MSISFAARQKFRQRLQSIEKADEILDSLDNFVDRFQLINESFSSNSFETIYEYIPESECTVMLTFSVLAKDAGTSKIAGFKRTAIFTKSNGVVTGVAVSQSDFTGSQDGNFSVKFVGQSNKVLIQVKGATSNLTSWQGSLEIEYHIGG